MDPEERRYWESRREADEFRKMEDNDRRIRELEQEDWVRNAEAWERQAEREKELRHAEALWRVKHGCFCGVGPDWRPRKDCPDHGHEAEPACGVCSFNFYPDGQGGVASELIPNQGCPEHQADWERKQEEERVAREQAAEQARKEGIERKDRQEEERKQAERVQAQKQAKQAKQRAKEERRTVLHWIIAIPLTILALPIILLPILLILVGLGYGVMAVSGVSDVTAAVIAGFIVVPLGLYAIFWAAQAIKGIVEVFIS